jgi:hypothetical protein
VLLDTGLIVETLGILDCTPNNDIREALFNASDRLCAQLL